jgi:hypothetical protein
VKITGLLIGGIGIFGGLEISRIGEIGRIRIAPIEQHIDLPDSPDRLDLDTSDISDIAGH